MSEIGEAFITVRPDIEFGNLLRDITRQVDQAAEVIERQTENMERSFRDLAETIRTELRQGFDRVERQAESTGESLQRSFEEAGRQAENALNDIGGALVFDRVTRQAEAAGERIERSFREASRQSERHLRGLSVFSGTAFGNIAAQAAAALGRALVDIGRFGLQLAGGLEVAASSFEILLGSAKAADSFIRDLQQFAAETPFEFAQITDTARRLLAVADAAGLARNEIIPTIAIFGNMITLLGQPQASLNRVILAFGQIASRGKVVTQELRQISEALPGFNPFEALARGFGVSTAAMTKMVEDGAVPAREGIAILLAEMKKFPGAAGSMERFTATITGTWQKFTDTLQIALAEGLQPLLPTLKDLLNGLVPLLELGITPLIAVTNDFVEKAIPPLLAALETIGPAFANFMGSLFEGFVGIGRDFQPIIDGIAAAFESLGAILASVGRALGPIVSAVFGQLSEILPTVTDAITTFIDTVGPPLARALEPVVELFGAILEAAAPVIEMLGEIFAEVLEALTPALDEVGEALEIVAAALGEALLVILEELGPELPDLARAFGELAVALAELLVALTPLLVPLAELAAIILTQSVGTFTTGLNILADVIGFLTPIVEGLAFVLAEFLIPAVQDVVRFFQRWRDTILGRLLDGLQNLYNDVLIPLGDLIGGSFIEAWESLGDIWDTAIIGSLETIYDVFSALWNDVIIPLGEALSGPFSDAWGALATPFADVDDAAGDVLGTLSDLFNDVIVPIRTEIQGAFIDGWDQLVRLWNESVVPAAGEIRDVLSELWTTVKDIATTLRDEFLSVWDEIVRVWEESVKPSFEEIKQAFLDFMAAAEPVTTLLRDNWIVVLGAIALALGPFTTLLYLAVIAMDAFGISVGDVANALGIFLVFGLGSVINILATGFALAIEGAGQALRIFLAAFIMPAARALSGAFSVAIRVAASFLRSSLGGAIVVVQIALGVLMAMIRPVIGILGGALKVAVQVVSSVFRVFASLIGTTARVLSGTLGTAIRVVGAMLRGGLVAAINIAKGAWGGLRSSIGAVVDVLRGIISAAESAIRALGRVRDAIPSIPDFGFNIGPFGFGQHGGLFTGPTPLIIGEAGPELLLPLSDPGRSLSLLSQSGLLNELPVPGSGIALTVIVNVTSGSVSLQDSRRIGETVGSTASKAIMSTMQQRRIAAISRVR